MELTTKLNLKKPGLTDYVNVSDLNDNMEILDTEVGALKEGSTVITDLQTQNKTLSGAINEIKTEVNEHKADSMPHQFVDGIKTYRWGFRTLNGQPQFIYEEVVE